MTASRPDSPAYLIAYPFLDSWAEQRGSKLYRRWVLDSGAFSAHTQGAPIDKASFHRAAKAALDSNDPPSTVFGLDVIGDWRASLRNVEEAVAMGIPAVPTFHYGDPEDYLLGIAKDYPMIALGGVARLPNQTRLSWAKQCFARVWPLRMHGFSLCSRMYVLELPFYSVDSTAWFLQSVRYHRFAAHGGGFLPRGASSSLRPEVDKYLELEALARIRWRREMVELSADGPTLYLALPDAGMVTGYEK